MENVAMPVVKTVKPLHFPQTIQFTGHDDNNSAEVYCDDVTIFPSSGKHESGSSKVKLKNIVDFSWELRFYTGQLLAVHVAGKYVAYGIKSVGKSTGVVRVVNRDNNERSLLKGMEGMVQDIAFAHIPTQVVLACVDEFGNLLVHQIEEKNGKTECSLLLHVEHSKDPVTNVNHRVIWCPYIPEEEPPANDEVAYDDVAKLLVLTHGAKAELWNVGVVTSRKGVGPLRPENVEEGYLEINEHTQPIVDAAFSPDGTALATASLDGEVKFFQVYMLTGGKPRCLHQWQPHDGKPLSSLFFLDNHTSYNPDVQFWKFAITGAENNSELKIWSCESWSCLQTIRFTPEDSKKGIVLKAGLDLGAGYLLLSDIYNKLLYVLQLYKDPEETCAFVRSASEFLLPYPILSFGIVDAGLRNFKSPSLEDLTNEDGDDDSSQYVQAVVVRMYLVQPKSLQECHIAFQPPAVPGDMEKLKSISRDSLIFRDGFSDLSLNGKSVGDPDCTIQDLTANHLSESQQPANRSGGQQQLNLMTPDAFSSPAKKDSPTELVSPLVGHHSDNSSSHVQRILGVPLAASPTIIGGLISSSNEEVRTLAGSSPKGSGVMMNSLDQPLAASSIPDGSSLTREGFASGGSSPSREVQEILSLQDRECLNHGYFDEKNNEEECLDAVKPVLEIQPKPTPPKDKPQFDALPNEKEVVIKSESDGWPQIPKMLVPDKCKSGPADENPNKRNSAGHVDRVLGGSGDDNKNQYLMALNERLEMTVASLSDKINSLVDIMQQQQQQIKELRCEVQDMQQTAIEEPQLASSGLETTLGLHLEKAMTKQHQQYKQTFENLMVSLDDMEKKRTEATMSTISQVVGNLVVTKLDDVISSEMKNNIIPAIIDTLDPLKQQLHHELTQKLTSTDHLLKENIVKLVHSKAVMEVFSNALVTAVQPAMQTCFKEMFTSFVLPCFEKSCQTMFHQINDSFSRGTKEYLATMDSHFDKQRRQQDRGKDIVTQLHALSESMRANSEHLATVVQKEVQTQLEKGQVSIQESLKTAVAEAVKEHVAKGFRAHKAVIEDSVITAVRSRAVTPAPHIVDTQLHQSQLLQLISQGHISQAFQQALSASDLSLVVFVCEKVNPQQVFSQTPCPLQQAVLLSLIQQLSADMTTHTELKHKYLEEAVVNLKPTDPTTREHMPSVIANLRRQLSAYISSNPNHPITRKLRMLHMATQSLLSSPH
ncbi:enhancer of mRNA-decapping protein 4 [Anabrus simplex]|uniref:enhancer of mRNA-decapping protein 4 n=1 Tax=Anabrus simplex TaxID=316456 RepID=UPI0035A27CC0